MVNQWSNSGQTGGPTLLAGMLRSREPSFGTSKMRRAGPPSAPSLTTGISRLLYVVADHPHRSCRVGPDEQQASLSPTASATGLCRCLGNRGCVREGGRSAVNA